MTADTARSRLGVRRIIGDHWTDKIITSEHRRRWMRRERYQQRKAMHKHGAVPPLELWASP